MRMYQKVMVPLDGSQFAECSLEHLRAIAIGCHVVEVVLFRVVEPLSSNETADLAMARGKFIVRQEREDRTQLIAQSDVDYSNDVLERMGTNKAEAEDYISRIVQKLVKEGIAARGEVVNGRAAESILDYAEKNNVDLIIMSTHGRSGASRWAFGSVADKVVRSSVIPVLSISPPGCRIDMR